MTLEISNKPTFSPQDYVSDTYLLGEEFYKSSQLLLKESFKNFENLTAAGFLAAHSAELYIKALVVAYSGSSEIYNSFRKVKNHDLRGYLTILVKLDSEASRLEPAINRLNKFSGDKVRYVENSYDESAERMFGSDDIQELNTVRNYVRNKLD